MKIAIRILLASIVALVFGGWVVTCFGPPGLVPRVLGTGGFIPRPVKDAPHPFTFDQPRFWDDSTDEPQRAGQTWDVLILGPLTDEGVTFATLEIDIRPTASRNAEHPVPGEPYTSLENFANRHLPSGHTVIGDSTTIVDGRHARDVTYDYVFYRPPHHAPAAAIPSRGRAIFFEDRGYYYMLSYATRDAEYDRYVEVFERMVGTFRFLD